MTDAKDNTVHPHRFASMPVLQRKQIWLLVFLWPVALGLAWDCLCAAAEAPQPQVLVLNSYHHGFPWSDDELAGLLARLRQDHPNMDPYVEYLDEKRFPGKDHPVLMKDHLSAKYRGKRIDLLIALDNPALDLALR